MKKKLFSLLLILGLIACLTLCASAEEVGGSFDDFTWKLDTVSGKLTISGEGAMGSFSLGRAPWNGYRDQIRSVVIGPGAVNVGDHAFENYTALTSVTIPESVQSINSYAFNGCTGLTQVKLPSQLLYISTSAFEGTGLVQVNLPDTLLEISSKAFSGCKSLIELTIPASVEKVGNDAFYRCTALISLTIEDGVKKVGRSAFWGCSSLLELTVPGSITQWDPSVFSNCTNLQTLTLEEGLVYVPDDAFNACTALKTVCFPSTLERIGARGFEGCKALETVTLPEGFTTLGTKGFSGCSALNSITLPDTLTSMGTDTFINCDSLTRVTIPGSLSVVPDRAFELCDKLETVIFEEGVTTLGHSLFEGSKGLKELVIPASVIEVKPAMCHGCDNLRKVVFLGGTVNIGTNAFRNCGSLEEVILPDTLQSIGGYAFYQCSSLKNITIPGSVTVIGDNAFALSGLRSAKLEEGILQLPVRSFQDAHELIYVVLPGSLKLVNEYTFNGCNLLCHALITGPETEIIVNKGNDAFVNSVKHFNAKGDEITMQEDCTSVFAYCSICDKAIYSETKKNAEHKFGDWILTTAPTTSAEGVETRTCSVCDKTETRSVAKLPSRNPFTDVPEGAYYEEPVIWAVDENITTGITPTTFQPKAISSRGQVVTFLWRCAGCPEPKTGLNPFDDVAEGKFYYKAVLWAVENGITNGTSDTTFSPNKNCTRGHVVTFLHRYLGNPEPASKQNPFTDVESGKYFYDAVLWAVDAKVTTGTSATAFSPNNECKRCEIVTFLYRALFKL